VWSGIVSTAWGRNPSSGIADRIHDPVLRWPSSVACAVEAALSLLRNAAARHPRRAGAPLAEVARQTAQPGVAAGDRGAGAAARRPARRAGHARRTERKLRASRGLRATFWNHAAIDSRRWRTGGSSGRRSRRRGGRRAGIRRAGAGPLSDSALSSALLGGFYRAGLESPHWRRPHAALGCVAGAERLLGGLDAHPAAAALIGPTR